MATRPGPVFIAATLADIQQANVYRDSEGNTQVRMNVAAEGRDDSRVVALASVGTADDRAAFGRVMAAVLAAALAQDPAYS